MSEDRHDWEYMGDAGYSSGKCRWKCRLCQQTAIEFDRPDFDLKFYVGNAGPFLCSEFIAAQVMES